MDNSQVKVPVPVRRIRRPKQYSLLKRFFHPCLNIRFWFGQVGIFAAGFLAYWIATASQTGLLGMILLLAWWGMLFMYVMDVFLQTASDDDDLTIVPSTDFTENFWNLLWFGVGAFWAVLPISFFIGFLKFAFPFLPLGLMAFPLTLFGTLFLLPILLLSGMANESSFQYYNWDVIRSVKKMWGTWLLFYVLSFLDWVLSVLVFFVFCGWLVRWREEMEGQYYSLAWGGSAIFACGVVLVSLMGLTLYARLLGRLARKVAAQIKSEAEED